MDNTGFSSKRLIPVQICYAEPENQVLLDIEVPENTRLVDAILQSGITEKLPHAPKEGEVGIFGKKRPLDTPLKAHDRIEIYRPLKIEPQEARRLRVRQPTGN
ncbi:RnfH family protein [Oxalobacter paraformigenes]|uniref:UPF0125 protein OFAG_02053 n=1 Tax=Oxalobacter paraformigenes TaxID=556268 RepID=C3X6R4_9BURK|nr:RnfH family protein [Oxalobacter paraformigenes]EEO28900.1 hypothetical protein OFAG_02053 [Oxalobacter paraformigenes]